MYHFKVTVWLVILWFTLPTLCFLAGYMVKQEQLSDEFLEQYTYCKSPQSEGDITRAQLVDRDGVLTLVCTYHSVLKNVKI